MTTQLTNRAHPLARIPVAVARTPGRILEHWLGNREHDDSAPGGWGMLAPLALIASVGLLIVSLSFSRARGDATWSEILFWAGLALVFVPLFGRLLAASPSRRERLGLVLLLGLGFYIIKVMHSPIMFTHHDEFLHWRTTSDIISTGELFSTNPMLPVSALFPGLENVTTALMHLGGMDIFAAGTIVIGTSRIVLVLSLFLLFESAAKSFSHSQPHSITSRSESPTVDTDQPLRASLIAGIATALYLVHPNSIYFNGMYKYESMALAFAALALYAMVHRQRVPAETHRGFSVLALLAIVAITVTHHIAAYAFIALLLLWFLVSKLLKHYPINRPTPGWLLFAAVTGSLLWLVFVANIVIGYISPHVTAAITEIISIISGDPAGGRELFSSSGSSTGSSSVPLWERVTALSAVAILVTGIPIGLWMIWRSYRTSAIALTLGIGVLAYPAGLALRFTGSGWEIGNRTSEFVFLMVGFVVATGIVLAILLPGVRQWRTIAITLCGVVILFGGIISGWPPAWRLPGPYEAAHAGTRSVEAQGISSAEWAREHLGARNRVAADSTNHLLMGAIGQQDVQTSLSGGLDAKWVLFAPDLNQGLVSDLSKYQVEYLVVDERWASEVETSSQYPDTPVSLALAKFDTQQGIDRVFDSGDVVIYDMQAITREESQPIIEVRDHGTIEVGASEGVRPAASVGVLQE